MKENQNKVELAKPKNEHGLVWVEPLVILPESGCIEPDSEKGKRFGFTKDLFEGYLFESGKDIYISFIISLREGKGNLRKLFDSILEEGYNVKVPTPFARMEMIIKKMGFKHTVEYVKEFGEYADVWIKRSV